MSRAPALVVALVAWLVVPTVHAFALSDLAVSLATVTESRVRFTDVRTVAALGSPLERRGTLVYVRPGKLEMLVEAPVTERVSVTDGTMTVESRGTTRVVDLRNQPPLLAWIEGIRATLAGDEAALRRHFEPAVSGTLERWSLVLVPRDARLRSVVARVSIAGERERLRTIEVDEVSGDRSVMTLAPAGAASK